MRFRPRQLDSATACFDQTKSPVPFFYHFVSKKVEHQLKQSAENEIDLPATFSSCAAFVRITKLSFYFNCKFGMARGEKYVGKSVECMCIKSKRCIEKCSSLLQANNRTTKDTRRRYRKMCAVDFCNFMSAYEIKLLPRRSHTSRLLLHLFFAFAVASV